MIDLQPLVRGLGGTPGERRPPAVILLALGVGIASVTGLVLAIPVEDTTERYGIGAGVVLALNALSSLLAMPTTNPLGGHGDVDRTGRGELDRLSEFDDDYIRWWVVFGLSLGAQLVVGLAVAGVVVVRGGDASVFGQPFLLLLAAFIGSLGAVLVALIVGWPLVSLVTVGWRLLTRRPVDDHVTAGAVMLLLIVSTGLFLAFGVDADLRPSTNSGRGMQLLIIVWLDYGGSPLEQAMKWAARGTMIMTVIAGVWYARTRRGRDQAVATAG